MQILCESCGQTGPAASIDVLGTEVHVTCGACGYASSVGAESAKRPAPEIGDRGLAPNLPPTKCPKCGHRQHDKIACHKCGLVFARVRNQQERPWDAAPAGKEQAVARAKVLWTSVEADPTEANHQAFVDHTRRTGIAAWAVMRYRHWLADYPNDEVASSQMAVVLADAQAIAATLASTGSADSYAANAKKVRVALLVVVILMCVGIAAIGVWLFGARTITPF